jgi:hypothetical protein
MRRRAHLVRFHLDGIGATPLLAAEQDGEGDRGGCVRCAVADRGCFAWSQPERRWPTRADRSAISPWARCRWPLALTPSESTAAFTTAAGATPPWRSLRRPSRTMATTASPSLSAGRPWSGRYHSVIELIMPKSSFVVRPSSTLVRRSPSSSAWRTSLVTRRSNSRRRVSTQRCTSVLPHNPQHECHVRRRSSSSLPAATARRFQPDRRWCPCSAWPGASRPMWRTAPPP